MWIVMAVLSAFFAGITAILAKCGIRHTDSDVATAVRTVVVLLFSWLMVLVVGSGDTITQIDARSLLFLVLSGLATGGSWLCYFKALSLADVNKVAPVDKSSTILSVLLAMVLFSERNHLILKLAGTALLGVGIYLMIERKPGADGARHDSRWLIYAVLSAVFAALTSILAKIGIRNVESNLGTAIRTMVVLAVSWGIVAARGKLGQVRTIDRRELWMILLSGVTTGASWLCYYYAIGNGVVSVVVPIDKMSILVTVAFSWLFLGERLSAKAALGLALMLVGTVTIALCG